MNTYSPKPGSVAATVIDIVRRKPGWHSAVAIKAELGMTCKITEYLSTSIRAGLLEVHLDHGRAYYRIPRPATTTRFQLDPVWPPGFVSAWA